MPVEIEYLPTPDLHLSMRREFVSDFAFGGCKFNDHFNGFRFITDPLDKSNDPGALLTFDARLLNPESPTMIYSYHGYRNGDAEHRKWTAAWLISHWYEHALNICECVTHKPNSFRHSFIRTILYLEDK